MLWRLKQLVDEVAPRQSELILLIDNIELVAEDATYRPMLRHPEVAEAADGIAGRFKVHRIEISSEMSLRDIITGELMMFFDKLGEICKHLPFRFAAGVREAAFDSSRFEYVPGSLRRVKEGISMFEATLLAAPGALRLRRTVRTSIGDEEKG